MHDASSNNRQCYQCKITLSAMFVFDIGLVLLTLNIVLVVQVVAQDVTASVRLPEKLFWIADDDGVARIGELKWLYLIYEKENITKVTGNVTEI